MSLPTRHDGEATAYYLRSLVNRLRSALHTCLCQACPVRWMDTTPDTPKGAFQELEWSCGSQFLITASKIPEETTRRGNVSFASQLRSTVTRSVISGPPWGEPELCRGTDEVKVVIIQSPFKIPAATYKPILTPELGRDSSEANHSMGQAQGLVQSGTAKTAKGRRDGSVGKDTCLPSLRACVSFLEHTW